MRIAIIGAGNVGSALSKAAVDAGHAVTLTATSPEKAAKVAAETGARGAASNLDAVADADVVVLAVPGNAVGAVAQEIAPAVRGKVVVDATNPLNATFTDLDIEETAAVQTLQRLVADAAVVKAFNTIFAGRLGTPTESGHRLDAFYAGDDTDAKKVVAELLTSLGFRPIDAGGLRMARALEEMAFLNIALNAGNNWPWQSGWALLGPTV
ncbi:MULTISPECIES: NADPH-dependent F420 reductase [unclassified Amycolatopsis]|uniref:NADPH-dependent F420 reductase n=1 Tax=unclassified Amycolatopsis TaxID=2618356 RepID=UPI001C6A0962|nr:prephenate dehydrogenase/arogenate dehydrogenase family protein [Amycolatopsis sp. DSM 110486]QYN23250.1 prephenate dehydrogenase/arogenate dehydrogenase family protein [Amycolatopsis sp. DSM 110486]